MFIILSHSMWAIYISTQSLQYNVNMFFFALQNVSGFYSITAIAYTFV